MEGSMLSGSYLPPGFRFHPTDQELISHYMRKKVTNSLPPTSAIIADIDLYKFNPWELPEKAIFGEKEWFFFSPRERKYPNGVRPNRAAGMGYWKATGTDKPILAADGIQCIGVKKALVFYKGRPPKGTKTEWLMHEYRLLDSTTHQTQKQKDSMRLDDWVLCRVRLKGSSPVETGEVPESFGSLESVFINSQQQKQQQQMAIERSSVYDQWNDTQLLGYLLGSPENGEISKGEDSDSGSDTRCSDVGEYLEMQQQSPKLVATAYSSTKRKASLGMAMDEMLLQHSKRLQCSNDGQYWWPADSYIDQGAMEFLL